MISTRKKLPYSENSEHYSKYTVTLKLVGAGFEPEAISSWMLRPDCHENSKINQMKYHRNVIDFFLEYTWFSMLLNYCNQLRNQ